MHPNKDTIYCLSYPRSGSSWFRHCFGFITETNTDNNQEILYHSHSYHNETWTLQDTYDVKIILLLRNYKEATFSEINNVYSRNPIATMAKLLTHVKDNPGILSKHEYDVVYAQTDTKAHWDDVADVLLAFKTKQYINDFLVPSFPNLNVKEMFPPNMLEKVQGTDKFKEIIHHLPVHRYHFALQLKNYYELLEYYDKVASINPDNALIIKYENMMQNPSVELGKTIDFMTKTHWTTPKHISQYRDRVRVLLDNIKNHKLISIDNYRSKGHMATSYKKDNVFDFHRQAGEEAGLWDERFLLDIDKTLKNKNSELFKKYLSDYEEKVN